MPDAWRELPLLDRAVLADPPEVVAPRLLGTLLVTGDVVARLVEVEAYGPDDPASHAARGETAGNATMFRDPGHLYVYISYGVHHLGNVTVQPEGTGAAVLLRSIEVLAGEELALRRRGAEDSQPRRPQWVGGGPGRLGQVLDLRVARDDGLDLLDPTSRVTLRTDGHAPAEVAVGPRVGVTDAPDVGWRFWIAGHPAVSRYTRSPRAAPPAGPSST